jgi:hypothetical protein
MQLIFSEKCEPVNALLLILAKLCFDRNGYMVFFDPTAVKELG